MLIAAYSILAFSTRLRGVGVVNGVSLPSPIDLRYHPHNTYHSTV